MILTDFKTLLSALVAEKVRFIIIGGVAAIGHGMANTTSDLDICHERSPENFQALVRALAPSKPQLRIPEGVVPFCFDEKFLKNAVNLTLETKWGLIDLLGEVPAIGDYRNIFPRAEKIDFYGLKVDVLSLDDLIRAKKAAGRTKDKLHLLELEALRDIIRVQKK